MLAYILYEIHLLGMIVTRMPRHLKQLTRMVVAAAIFHAIFLLLGVRHGFIIEL